MPRHRTLYSVDNLMASNVGGRTRKAPKQLRAPSAKRGKENQAAPPQSRVGFMMPVKCCAEKCGCKIGPELCEQIYSHVCERFSYPNLISTARFPPFLRGSVTGSVSLLWVSLRDRGSVCNHIGAVFCARTCLQQSGTSVRSDPCARLCIACDALALAVSPLGYTAIHAAPL